MSEARITPEKQLIKFERPKFVLPKEKGPDYD
jgi:hypothetical protein